MYANPSYNDNHPDATGPRSRRSTAPPRPATRPGSTFKVVTATAAIDSGKYTPSSVVNGDSPKKVSGVPLANDANQSFGNIDLTTALTYSVNTVWAQVAESLGRATMTEYMKRFGFYSKPPLDYPSDEMVASRPYSTHGQAAAPRQPERGHRPDRDRPGRACESPRCRWRWWPRRWPTSGKLMTPAVRHQGRRPGRPHGQDDKPVGLSPGDEPVVGGRGDRR